MLEKLIQALVETEVEFIHISQDEIIIPNFCVEADDPEAPMDYLGENASFIDFDTAIHIKETPKGLDWMVAIHK